MMGRPERMLSEAQKAEVETLAAVLTSQQIADYFGIGRTTFFNMMARDPEIGEHYKRGKAKVIGSIAQGLIAKARSGDTASMIFFLKTQAGWRETNPPERVGPEEVSEPGEGAAAQIAAYLAEIAERQRQAQVIEAMPVDDDG